MVVGDIINDNHIMRIIVFIERRANGDRACGTQALRNRRRRRRAGAGAASLRQPDAALPCIKADEIIACEAGKINIGTIRESLVVLELEAILRRQSGRAGGDKNNAMRIAHIDALRVRQVFVQRNCRLD